MAHISPGSDLVVVGLLALRHPWARAVPHVDVDALFAGTVSRYSFEKPDS